MPHKYSVKSYVAGGIYHAFNRGVNKTDIFIDDQDYRVFLHLLKYYLSPVESLSSVHPILEVSDMRILRPRPLANLEKEVNLLAYCLMPNHFHLLIQQNTADGMTKLLRRISTTYAMYINKRYHRVGYLFQGSYKAVLVDRDNYLLHLSRYIHRNPYDLSKMTGRHLVSYPYFSYPYYLKLKHAPWIKPDTILSYFRNTSSFTSLPAVESYADFVEKYEHDSLPHIANLAIDA